MKYTISRSETIPFLDSVWQIMQMKNFEINVSISSEEWETLEDLNNQIDKVFNEQREIISNKIPLLERDKKRLNFLTTKLKELVWESEFKTLIEQTKAIN